MSMSKTRVRAMVRVTLEIEAGSVWGGECTFDQIGKQAEDGVRGLLTNGNPLCLKEIPHRIKDIEFVSVMIRKE